MPQPDPATANVVELCRDLPLSDPARPLVAEAAAPLELLDALAAKDLFPDAFLVMAAWLPRRESLWWGCLCGWHLDRPKPTPAVAAAYEAAVHWLQEPTEPHRRAAETAGNAAGPDTLGGALAQAAFYSDGSISRADLPPVVPPKTLAVGAVAQVVLAASSRCDPANKKNLQRHFLRLGLEILGGRHPWQ